MGKSWNIQLISLMQVFLYGVKVDREERAEGNAFECMEVTNSGIWILAVVRVLLFHLSSIICKLGSASSLAASFPQLALHGGKLCLVKPARNFSH